MSNKIEVGRELIERLVRLEERFCSEKTTVSEINAACAEDKAITEELRALLAAPVVERQGVLPCDVRVAPATTIRKGCKVETLMQCIQLREGRPDRDCHFIDSPPAPVAVVLPEQLIAAIEAEQARLSTEDYLMDSDDCIAVIRDVACLDKVKELNP